MKYFFRILLPVFLLIGALVCNIMIGAAMDTSLLTEQGAVVNIQLDGPEQKVDEMVVTRKSQIRAKIKKVHFLAPIPAALLRTDSVAPVFPEIISSNSKQAICYGLLFLQYLF